MRVFLIAALAVSASAPALAAPAAPPGQPLSRAREACQTLETSARSDRARPVVRRLRDLPPGLLQRAVLRTVDGCPVLEVKYGGKVYYVPNLRDAQPRRDLGRPAR